MLSIQGAPFAYGQGQGIIQRNPTAPAPDHLMLLTASQIEDFLQVCSTKRCRVAGLIVIGGGPLSHPMISALSMGQPIVVISSEQARAIADQAELVIDGGTGSIKTVEQSCLPPTTVTPEPPQTGTPIQTADGQAVALRVSIGTLESAQSAVENGATAIGLLRSECFYPQDGRQPAVDFYAEIFGQICRIAQGLKVAVRLLDIAPDKLPPWLDSTSAQQSPLGLRGVRLYDKEPIRSVVHAQVAALEQLASQYDVSILLPFITCLEEFLERRNQIEDLLLSPMAVGAMAETPIAVLSMGELLQHTSLVGIGCNDLMQYLFAADRDIAEVGALLNPYHPALFRLLHQAAQSAGEDIDRIHLCGLLSQVPGVLPALLGLGFRAFSVEPRLLPYLAEVVRNTDTDIAAAQAMAVCAAADARDVRTLLGLAPGSAWALG